MALPPEIRDREYEKFIDVSPGQTAVRVGGTPLAPIFITVSPPTTMLAGERNTALALIGVPLTGVSTPARMVVIQAKPANTGLIWIGNAITMKVQLTAGESIGIDIDDLNKIYIMSSVNSEGVNYVGGA